MAGKCLGKNANGSPCSATPRASGYCMWHDPALAAERASWRRAGGQRRSNKARARKQFEDAALTPRQVEGLLSIALKQVLGGKLEPGVGNAAANLARALVQVSETASLAEEVAELRLLVERAS